MMQCTAPAATAKIIYNVCSGLLFWTIIHYSGLLFSSYHLLGLLVPLWSIVLLVGQAQGSRPDLFLEQINFVEENNERRLSEEDIVQHFACIDILKANNRLQYLLTTHQILSRSPAFCWSSRLQKVFDCSRSEK